MSTILYSTLNSFIRSKNVILSGRKSQRIAMHIFERMNRELLNRANERISDSALKSEPRSTHSNSRRRYLIGKHIEQTNASTDSIRFVTEGSAQELIGGLSNRGRVEVEYRVEKPEDYLSKSQDEEIATYVLVREEIPAGQINEQYTQIQKITFPVAENVVSFGLRYRRRGQWIEEWRGSNVGFPDAIELTLKLANERGEIDEYRSTFRTSNRLISSQEQNTSPTSPVGN
jgi:hypothetical protein